jgi:hypothetical protein
MLESNSDANLGTFGGKAHIVTDRPKSAPRQSASKGAAKPPAGVRVRDPKTGRTGTLAPGAAVPEGLEVISG